MFLRLVGDINETKILSAAQDFVSLGLKDAGYAYVNIDVGEMFMSVTKSTAL